MNTENKVLTRSFPIPLDMLLDVLKVVLKNELPNQIAGINVMENTVWLTVKFPAENPHSQRCRENIETLLSDYGYFTGSNPDANVGTENNF